MLQPSVRLQQRSGSPSPPALRCLPDSAPLQASGETETVARRGLQWKHLSQKVQPGPPPVTVTVTGTPALGSYP